jgi:hypothetical protein
MTTAAAQKNIAARPQPMNVLRSHAASQIVGPPAL